MDSVCTWKINDPWAGAIKWDIAIWDEEYEVSGTWPVVSIGKYLGRRQESKSGCYLGKGGVVSKKACAWVVRADMITALKDHEAALIKQHCLNFDYSFVTSYFLGQHLFCSLLLANKCFKRGSTLNTWLCLIGVSFQYLMMCTMKSIMFRFCWASMLNSYSSIFVWLHL